MLEADFPRLYFLVARMANGNEIGFLVSKQETSLVSG